VLTDLGVGIEVALRDGTDELAADTSHSCVPGDLVLLGWVRRPAPAMMRTCAVGRVDVRALNGPLQGHLETVNGDLVFTPSANGVQVNGTRTNYPSMEVYQDMADGTSHTVIIDNAFEGGQQGPMTNLPFHHDVGIGGKAFAPFDTGGWNPTYDVPTPLPSTPFGPVTSPPSVPALPSGPAVQE
jgi:hypothetical protein